MNITLIQGQFNTSDALGIITQMIHIKIKYHEGKISSNSNEEDIKNREAKIKQLQQDLFEMRKHFESKKNRIATIQAIIEIE